ncbi:MFS transporter [Paraburkholderia acidisoli]|nr:MFS transporter [Paraburkholderia acidisoli]
MLVISGVISTIDRAALAVANPLIRHDMGLSVAEMGFLLSAFLWAYAFAQLPVGVLLDRFGPRWLLAGGLALWSAAQAMCGMVNNTVQFAVARALLGVGEAPQFPTGARVTRDWFAARHRGRATGTFISSSYLGTGVAAPFLTVLMLNFGWHNMFIIMGVLGLVMAAIWAAFYRSPADVALTAEEHAYRQAGDEIKAASRQSLTAKQWGSLLKDRTTLGLVLGYFGITYVSWLFQSWLPGYLQMERHMSIAKVGWTAAIPYTCAVLGALSAGFVVDKLANAGFSLTNSRRLPICVILLLETAMVASAAVAPSNAVAVAAISGAMFCGAAAASIAWSAISVLSPTAFTGSLGALQNFGGFTGGALAPIVTGLIVQATGSFVVALFVGAGLVLLAACSYLFLVRGPITRLEAEPMGAVKAA